MVLGGRKLDGYDKLYRVMATSVRLDPQFASSTAAMINKVYATWAQEMQKQNAIVAAFQQHVIETLQGVTANQQHGSMIAAYGADQLVRGVQTFRGPCDHSPEQHARTSSIAQLT